MKKMLIAFYIGANVFHPRRPQAAQLMDRELCFYYFAIHFLQTAISILSF